MAGFTLKALGAIALLHASAVPVFAAPRPAPSPGVLATRVQLERERIMLKAVASPQMRQAVARLEKLYRADPQAKTATGAATIRRAVDSIAMAAANYVAGDDPARPAFVWTTNGPHRWAGLFMPRSGYGIDNPDNAYRNLSVAGGSKYLIRGRIVRPGPIEQHFALMDAIPGTTPLTAEGGAILGTLRSDAMQIAPDGTFTITVDSDPAHGRANHLQTPASGDLLIIVRDLFTHWNQNPVALTVERLSGPDVPPPTAEDIATRAAALLDKIGPYWLAYDNRFVYSRAVNQFQAPRKRPGGRGFSTAGHFSINRDEALVVTLDPLGATSLGIQLTDPWGVAYEYRDRTSSLNNVQARPNADGTLTFVISARDPGVENWLDPQGYNAGIYAIRWQGLPANADPEKALRGAQRVPLSRLQQALPAGTPRFTPQQRKQQRADRARAYDRRLCGDFSPSACARQIPLRD